MKIEDKNPVTLIAAAAAETAQEHYLAKLAFETDCWDVHATQGWRDRGFVLIDVRARESFERGHLPGAIHMTPHQLTPERLSEYPLETLFVVYCAGPHCNASTRAAARLSGLGRAVKEMIGGVMGWLDEGFTLRVPPTSQ